MNTEPHGRFSGAIAAIKQWQAAHPQDPAVNSEAQIAIDILRGQRPGIDAKYDALLLKLDRTYSHLEDRLTHWRQVADTTPLYRTRMKARNHVSVLAKLTQEVGWMRARNADMIEALSKQTQTTRKE